LEALEDAKIIRLDQLKALAPQLEQIQGMASEAAQVIKDRLARLTARRTVRVRLVLPKRLQRGTGQKSEMALNEQQVTSTVPSA
jgi:hypothetical protein